tara:strand:- start:116 stop:397 length:282 start_codon:yes stop_codon:yes gene_type:complete
MKISKRQLKRIIKEEKAKLLREQPDASLPAMMELENLIEEFSVATSRWFDQNENKLDPQVLDDPDSWAIQLEEIRFDLRSVVEKMMGGNRRIR